MHESSIVESLQEQARTFLPAGAKLLDVRVDVGVLEHLDEDVLEALWMMLADGTPLSGSRLSVTRIPLRIRCDGCRAEYAPEDPAMLLCPACGEARPEVLEGSGVVLKSIEVDVPEGDA